MLTKLLNKLNLLDNQNNLSITNIAVIVVLVKLVMTPQWSLNEAATLIPVLLNYAHKRYTNDNTQGATDDNSGSN